MTSDAAPAQSATWPRRDENGLTDAQRDSCLTDIPRTIVYFQYCPCMIHPLHRDVPYPGALSPYSAEERWLLGEPREPNRWVIGTDADKQRMRRCRREADK